MMGSFLWKGFLIGILFGIPVGAVGAITVKRTLTYGIKAGMLSGLGSSVADSLYACIGAFGVTFISDFLLDNQILINILGGSMILFMGIKLLTKEDKKKITVPQTVGAAKVFFPSFVIGITNPAAILTFLFAFTYFDVSSPRSLMESIGLVSGVFLGTFLWWIMLSVGVEIIKNKKSHQSFNKMNRFFGIILILFGAAIFVKIIQ